MSYASIETSGLMPQRTIVKASGAATPATPATTSVSETPAKASTASTPEAPADPATASTPETSVDPAAPTEPATRATSSTTSTTSESVSEKKSVETATSEQTKTDSSGSKSKTTSGNVKSSGSYSSGGSSGSYSSSSPYYGEVVQIVSAPPVQTETFTKPASGQNKTPPVTPTTKTQNTIKKSTEKGEKETEALKKAEKETPDESSVKIINSKHDTTQENTFNDFSGTEPEIMEESPETKEDSKDSFASVSKKIIIIVGAVLGITALAGGAIYYFSKKH